jgi:hypothetical protein
MPRMIDGLLGLRGLGLIRSVGVCLLVVPAFFFADAISSGLVRKFDAYSELRASVSIGFLSALACCLFVALSILRKRTISITISSGLLIIYLTITIAGWFIGALFLEEWSFRISTLLLAQTLFGLAAFWFPTILLGRRPSDDVYSLDGVVVCATLVIVTLSVSALGHITWTLLYGPGDSFARFSDLSPYWFGVANVKFKRIFPVMCATFSGGALSLAIVYLRQKRKVTALFFISCFAVLAAVPVMSWSRTAGLVGLVGCAAALYANGISVRGQLFLGATCALSLTVFVVMMDENAYGNVGFVAVERLRATVSALASQGVDADLGEGDERRLDAFGRGLSHGVLTPIGSMYAVYERGGEARVINTESGILDVAIRGGAIGLSAVLAVFGLCGRKLWTMRKRRPFVWRTFLPIFVAQIVGAVFINTPSDPYAAPVFWLILGLIVWSSNVKASGDNGSRDVRYSENVG